MRRVTLALVLSAMAALASPCPPLQQFMRSREAPRSFPDSSGGSAPRATRR